MPATITIKGKVYQVKLVEETDSAGNKAKVMTLTNGSDVKRLSPNTTDQELHAYADPNNVGHQ